MAAISTAIGLGIAAVGVGTSIYSASQQSDAAEAQIAAQQRAEAARQRAMEIDADRRRRQMVRQQVIARSQALATTTSQGAAGLNREGSGLPGAYGQIAGATAFGLSGINLSEQTGTELFAANQDLLAAKQDMSSAQSMAQIGGALSSFGGAMVNNYGAIDRIFGSSPITPIASSTSWVKGA